VLIEAKAPAENCSLTHPNSAPIRGGGKTNRCVHAKGHSPIPPDFLGAVEIPAIAKAIHTQGSEGSHTCQQMGTNVTPPRRDERKNKCAQVCIHWGNTDWPQGWALAERVTSLGVRGVAVLCVGPAPSPTSSLKPD
jgi:hypothetical protein